MKWRYIPNLLSLFRILLVPPAVWALVHAAYGAALTLIAVAGVTDALDGFLARRYQWTSRLGSILDPLADKLLMAASFITLGLLGFLPVWLVAVVVLRDLVIIGGALAYYYTIDVFEMEPTPTSKANTVAQVCLLVGLIASLYGLPVSGLVIDSLVWVVAVTTLISGVQYVWSWSSRAIQRRRGG